MSYDSKLNNSSGKFRKSKQAFGFYGEVPSSGATQIALLVSLILHFLLYKYGLPQFSLKTEVESEQQIPIVELSPLEQSRLPNLSPLEIPEFNNTPLSEDIQLFALPPSIPANPFPDLPPVPLPPPPQNLDLPPLPPIPPLPNTNIKLPPIGEISSLPTPPPLPPLESDIPQPEPPPPQPPQPQPPAESQPAPEPAPEPPQATAPPKPEPQPSPNQIAAQRQQKLNQNIRDLSQSLQKKETDSTEEEARKNYVAWLNEVKTVKPEPIKLDGTYPRDACIRRLEDESVYGVLVDAQGKITALDLIKGANYPIFNEQASNDIKAYSFQNNTDQPKPYQVTVDFKYDPDICPSLTLPSLRKDKPSKPETAAPKSTPAERQTPESPTQETPSTPAEVETPKPETSNSQSVPEETKQPQTPLLETPKSTPELPESIPEALEKPKNPARQESEMLKEP